MELTILGWYAVAPGDGRYRVDGHESLIWLYFIERVEIALTLPTTEVAVPLK